MKNKYYTPSIEEFYIGFEYEGVLVAEWKKAIVSRDSFCFGFAIDLQDSNIRVKCLDEKDIESLEFKRIPTEMGGLKVFKEGIYTVYLYNQNFLLHDKPKKEFLTVTREDRIRTPNEDGSFKQKCIFEGNVKNKSEFKKLLKQLNIG